MNLELKTSLVLGGLAISFLALNGAFRSEPWGRSQPVPAWPQLDASFTNTAPVRVSAAELIRSGGDASGLDCYACHDKGKPPLLHIDRRNHVTLPEEHNDLVMQHGRQNRNDNCYNCHDPNNLDKLKTKDGRLLTWEQSTLLCASCHGPTYRDWEIGIHGRTGGFWARSLGPAARLECASCHHPHAPEFAALPPAPAPRHLHNGTHATPRKEGVH